MRLYTKKNVLQQNKKVKKKSFSLFFIITVSLNFYLLLKKTKKNAVNINKQIISLERSVCV